MISSFVLLALAGGGVRLGLNWLIKRRFGVWVAIPQVLAAVLVLLGALPEMLRPFPIPLPFGVLFGLLLPDLLLRRAG